MICSLPLAVLYRFSLSNEKLFELDDRDTTGWDVQLN
jgi:hypothetical protein